jgi:hypothetical protein
MMQRAIFSALAVCALLVFQATVATAAVTPGQVDAFSSGLQSWQAGGVVNPNGPRTLAGGPDGENDMFLDLRGNGNFGSGGKLVVFNKNQWAGNYIDAAIDTIEMQVKNLGPTDLVLRLIFEAENLGQSLTTMAPVNVPSGSDWTTVTFPIGADNLTGGVFNTVMAAVTGLDIVHSPNVIPARSSAPSILAELGVDNITAVSTAPRIPTWNVDAAGNWTVATNWTGGVPNAVGVQAVFGDVITAPRTVTVDAPITAGRIDFDNTNTYTIAGTNAVSLSATSGNAEINVMRGSHVIDAPVTLASNLVVTVTPDNGSLTLGGAVTGATSSVTKAGPGTLTINQLQSGPLTISAGKVSIAADDTPNTPVVTALSIAGGATPTATLDIANNAAVIDYTGDSPVATVRQQITSGRGGTTFGAPWNGPGINSSTVATVNAVDSESRSVAYAENGALPLGSYTEFRGQPVDASAILLAYTRTGDTNLDGVVNDDDVTIVSATYAPGFPQPDWTLGDFDYNGFVDDDDITLLGVFYDPTAQPLGAAPAISGVAAVPEPAAWSLVAAAILVVIAVARRSRNRLASTAAATAKRSALR